MKSSNSGILKKLTFLSLVCMLIPLTLYGLWIYAFGLGTTQEERVAIFNSYLPGFLHSRYGATYISLVLTISTVILSSICLKLPGIPWKALNIIILVISTLLLVLNLFGMM